MNMESPASQKEQWFVVGTLTKNKEIVIRDALTTDNVCCYVPLRYTIKVVKKQKQRMLVPAINGLIFVRGTQDELKDYLQSSKYQLFLRKSTFSRKQDYLTVTDSAMHDFMRVMERAEEEVKFFKPDEIQLREGDKIIVKGGMFDGVEGYVMRIAGKRNKQLVVSIPEVTIAAVTLSPEMIELKERKENDKDNLRSKDVVGDTKRLTELSKRLLFSMPDKYCVEDEYNITKNEMQRIYHRLKPMKGIIAEMEGRIALALYLASKALKEDEDYATERLLAAIKKIKETSILRLFMMLYHAYFTHDSEAGDKLRLIIGSWDGKYSEAQRRFIEEFDKLFPSKY